MTKILLVVGAGTAAAYFAPKLVGNYVEGESDLPGSKQAGEFTQKNPRLALAALGGGLGALAAYTLVK